MPARPPDTSRQATRTWIAALARVMARVTASPESEAALGALAVGLIEEFDVALVRIWLYDPSDGYLNLRASAGLAGDLSSLQARLPAADMSTPVARVLAERAPIVIEDIAAHPTMPRQEWFVAAGLRSYACFPLVIGGQATGAMALSARDPWTLNQVEALEVVAQQAALALEHARLLDESHALQAAAADLASARDLPSLLDGLVEQAMSALGADAISVWLEDEHEGFRMAATRGLSDAYRMAQTAARRSLGGALAQLQRSRRPLYIRDDAGSARQRGDDTFASAIEAEGIQSTLRLPLTESGGHVGGMLSLYHRRERAYSDHELRLAQAFADQISVALTNVRLVERERAARDAGLRQMDRLTALARVTSRLLAATEPDAVLRVVAESATRLCDARGAMVGLFDPNRRQMTVVAAHGEGRRLAEEFIDPQFLTEEYLRESATGKAIVTGQAVAVEDYATWPPSQARDETLRAGMRAFIAAPMNVEGAAIGMLYVVDAQPRRFAPEDVTLLQTLAGQAALAIQHTRLARRDQDAAVLEERARLARDLHDSVTQLIFSLGMMARAAEAQYQRQANGLGGTLQRIAGLAQEALAEMRALLFELRPSAVDEGGLAGAIERLVRSYQDRADTSITFDNQAGPDIHLQPATETAYFRIVQEALGNALKHAGADAIHVSLANVDGQLVATVADDGRGFVPVEQPARRRDGGQGGFGMTSMRERAEAAELTLDIASAPGAGTRVTVTGPLVAVQR